MQKKYLTKYCIISWSKLSTVWGYLSIIEALCEKPTISIILKVEKLRAFPLRSGTWQRCPLSAQLCNIVLKVSASQTTIRQVSNQTTKRNKRHSCWAKKKQTLTLCTQHDTAYGKPIGLHPKTASTHTAKWQDTKSMHRNHLDFHTLTMRQKSETLRNWSHWQLLQNPLDT